MTLTPSARLVGGLAVFGALFGAAVLIAADSGRAPTSTTTLFSGAVGGLYLLTGVFAHRRQPTNRVGLQMVLVGIAWFAEDLQVSENLVVHTAGLFVRATSTGFLVHLLLAFPDGRLRSRVDRAIVAVTAITVFGLIPLGVPFYASSETNLLLVTDLHHLQDALINSMQVGVAFAIVVVLVARWWRATPPARRVLAPVLSVGFAGGIASATYPFFRDIAPGWAAAAGALDHASTLALPLAFLAGVWRIRLGRTAVAELMVRLRQAPPGQLRELLADALGDPSLQVGYVRPGVEDAGYVDERGQPLSPRPAQAVTPVERNGRQVAALLHDPALVDDRHVLDAVTSAVALELDNRRLAAEVRAQLLDVRASRARIFAMGDEQRRKVERDLHDGAQQQLVTVALILQMARQQAAQDADPALGELLRRSAEGLECALGELRELARGIHPAVLTEAGLLPALRGLAARCGRPVEVEGPDLSGLPAHVAATAYFVAAESVTNALKHAAATSIRVRVCREGDRLQVTVTDDGRGGVDRTAGTGLLGLQDRVSAVDGELTVHSAADAGTTVHADLPLGPG